MHTVAFSYCAWHTHCTQVGKDRSITVRRRKDAVSCNPCPSAKKKKKIIWIKLMQEYSSLSSALLCWQNETSKALGIKIHCNTQREHQKAMFYGRKKEPCHATHRTRKLFFSVQLCIGNPGPGSGAWVGAVLCIPAFCLLALSLAEWDACHFFCVLRIIKSKTATQLWMHTVNIHVHTHTTSSSWFVRGFKA